MIKIRFKKIKILNKMDFHKIIIFTFIAIFFTTSSCWDGGVGPYESDKGYCEYKKYSDDNSALCFSMLIFANKNPPELNNACLMVLVLEEASCKDKPTYKPYWLF